MFGNYIINHSNHKTKNMTNTILDFKKLNRQDYKSYFEKGISYSQYFENTEKESLEARKEGNAVYVPQNLQRMKRIAKTLRLNEDIIQAVKELTHKANWLVISEHWCGDASQSLPVLNALVQLSDGKIDLKIVYRDENLELMDAHLTGTSRSIPKLIQLDSHFNITGIWGPRPSVAQKLVLDLKKNPETAKNYNEVLHKWYADDKQQAIQKEVLKLLQKANQFCTDCFI